MRSTILALALGLLLLQQQPVLPGPWAWVVAAISGGLGLILRAGHFKRLLVLTAAFATGFAWAAWRAELRLADTLPPLWQGRDILITGVIASLPQTLSDGERFEFAVESVLTPGARVPARLLLSARTPPAATTESSGFRAGERWRLQVRLRRPAGQANPHGFDYTAWLLERNLRAVGEVRPGSAARLDDQVHQFGPLIERIRQSIRERMQARLPTAHYPDAGILLALAIGDQRAIDERWWPIFNRTGVTHALSISGLHVTLFATLAGGGLALLWRRVPALALRCPAQRAGLICGGLAALAYSLLSGFAVPAQRTVYMLLAAIFAHLLGRPLAPGRVWCLALGVVLVLDPWAVLAPGFWLSFAAVGALLFVGQQRETTAHPLRARLRQWLATQHAATLATLPILLFVFQQHSLVSPLANAVTIPVVSLLLTPLALISAFWPIWPLPELGHALLQALLHFLNWCAQWPLWEIPAPPLWATVAAGLGGVLWLLPRGMPLRWLGLPLLLPALTWPADRPAEGTLRLWVLDVGQGLAVIAQTHRHQLLYDPGPRYGAGHDAGERIVLPMLRSAGIRHLDRLIVSHRDSDHAGGLASVVAGIGIGERVSSMRGIGARPCRAGDHWQWDGVHFEFLHPVANEEARPTRSNHLSCVLRIQTGEQRLLLTGDIEVSDELDLLRRYRGDLAATVLVVPHHGSRSSSSGPFVQAVAPRLALFSVGSRNRFGHPKAEVVARYADQGTEVWRTDADGALRLEIGPHQLRIGGWRDSHVRYWHGR